MQQKDLMKPLIGDYYAVEVPVDAYNFRVNQWANGSFDLSFTRALMHKLPKPISLPNGQWELVGEAYEVTEEQAAGIVDCEMYAPEEDDYDLAYMNYEIGALSKITALQSFASLLASQSLNPVTTVILRKL